MGNPDRLSVSRREIPAGLLLVRLPIQRFGGKAAGGIHDRSEVGLKSSRSAGQRASAVYNNRCRASLIFCRQKMCEVRVTAENAEFRGKADVYASTPGVLNALVQRIFLSPGLDSLFSLLADQSRQYQNHPCLEPAASRILRSFICLIAIALLPTTRIPLSWLYLQLWPVGFWPFWLGAAGDCNVWCSELLLTMRHGSIHRVT